MKIYIYIYYNSQSNKAMTNLMVKPRTWTVCVNTNILFELVTKLFFYYDNKIKFKINIFWLETKFQYILCLLKVIFSTFKNYQFIQIRICIRIDKYLFDKFDNLSRFFFKKRTKDNQILTKVFAKKGFEFNVCIFCFRVANQTCQLFFKFFI